MINVLDPHIQCNRNILLQIIENKTICILYLDFNKGVFISMMSILNSDRCVEHDGKVDPT